MFPTILFGTVAVLAVVFLITLGVTLAAWLRPGSHDFDGFAAGFTMFFSAFFALVMFLVATDVKNDESRRQNRKEWFWEEADPSAVIRLGGADDDEFDVEWLTKSGKLCKADIVPGVDTRHWSLYKVECESAKTNIPE